MLPKVKRILPGDRVEAHHRQEEPDEEDDQPLDDRTAGEGHGQQEPQRRQGEIFGGAEIEGEFGQRRGEEGQADHGNRAGDERSDGGDAQGRARAPFLGHLVAVDAGDDGGRLAGEVQQNGGGRAPVHGAVENPRHHDDRRHRGADDVGDREEKGNGGRRTQTREDADGRADEGSEEGKQQVGSREGDGEALQQSVKMSMASAPLADEKFRGDRHLQKVDEKDVHRERPEKRDEDRLEPPFAFDHLLPGHHEEERRGDIADGLDRPAVEHHEGQG